MRILLPFILLCSVSFGTTYFVDPTASGSGTGLSWANAWTSLGSMTGLVAGDEVQISGGSSGNTQTYTLTGEFTSLGGFASGSAGNVITYRIGQDSSHNGTAIFHRSTNGSQFLFGGNYYVISGQYLTGSDNIRHFKLDNYYQLLTWNSVTGARASYIDCGDCGGFGSINPGTSVELDHCYLYSTDMSLDHGLVATINQGTAYDQSLFHDNVMNIPFTTGGFGADGFQLIGTGGWSLYNNTVTGFSGGGVNHQDGWQGSGGSYIKIYNNRFTDMQNYSLFGEGFTVGGQYTHMKVYNNICVLTSATGQSSSQQAIALSGNASFPANDVVCINNMVDGYTSGNAYTFWTTAAGPTPAAFINCYFENNSQINSGSNLIDGAITSATNVSVTSGNAPTYFTSWTSGSGSNNYVLLSGATPLIHTGTNASSLGITTDYTGASYANPPSVGPYEFGGSSGGGGSALSGAVTLKGGVVLH